jgi:hypothetical protein
MTKSVNINLASLRHVLSVVLLGVANVVGISTRLKFLGHNLGSKTLAASMITAITLVVMTGVIAFTSEHSINAQMMMGDRGGSGNTNTSLTQAMTIAEQSVGNNSFAIAAFDNVLSNDPFAAAALGQDRAQDLAGNLVHSIILDTPGTEFYHVIVDPGNGQVLATQELSQKELETMHLEHSKKVMAEPHLVNGTFVH